MRSKWDVQVSLGKFYTAEYRLRQFLIDGSTIAEVGKVLAGSGSGYNTVSSFFSEVFGTTVKVFGDVSRFDELTTEGSLASGTLLSSYGESGRLVGALTVGASDEFEALLKDLIAEHAPIDAVERELVGGRSR